MRVAASLAGVRPCVPYEVNGQVSNSLNLELPYVQGAQAQKHVNRERCAPAIDSVVQLTSKTATAGTRRERNLKRGPPHRCRVSRPAVRGHRFEVQPIKTALGVFYAEGRLDRL
jgi:hypothetical protein